MSSTFWAIPNLPIFLALLGIWHELTKLTKRDRDNSETGDDA